MSKIKVRAMYESDIEGIMEIESISFGQYHWSKQAFATEIENPLGHYFTALDSDYKVVGYCGFWLIDKEAHITTIAVHPDLRGQSIGELLLQNMINAGYANDVKWFTLEVRTSNTPAKKMYEKYGFDCLGVRSKYYQDNNEDALIMWTKNIWDEEFKTMYEKNKQSYLAQITN